VRIDQPDDPDPASSGPDVPQPHRVATQEPQPEHDQAAREPNDAATRTERSRDYRAIVEHSEAIERAYERLREVEQGTVTPAMRRVEAEDPDRHLAGLDKRLKGMQRLAEKVEFDVQKKGRDVNQAVSNVKDVIRYTFVYSEEAYTAGVYADCERLYSAGFERFDRRNSWDHDEYKGINSRWRIPGYDQLFEVQFHTPTSLAAKEETHASYERIRSLAENDAEVAQLHDYQRQITSKVPIPPGALDIPDYRL
jgi:hypothetical protein